MVRWIVFGAIGACRPFRRLRSVVSYGSVVGCGQSAARMTSRRLDHRGDLRADGQAELLDRFPHRDRGHQAGAACVQFDVGDGLGRC